MISNTVQIQELARRGAEARIKELGEEIKALYRMFPGIEGEHVPARARRAPVASVKAPRVRVAVPKKTGGRSGWSAEARKAVGLRMKKYWAARRKAEAA
jgi:hypothetical protein